MASILGVVNFFVDQTRGIKETREAGRGDGNRGIYISCDVHNPAILISQAEAQSLMKVERKYGHRYLI